MRFLVAASVLFTAAVAVFASPVVERKPTPASIAVILANLKVVITPPLGKIRHANAHNATPEFLSPIICEITTAMKNTGNNITSLSGVHANVIMASVDGTTALAEADVLGLFYDILELIFMAVVEVLNVASFAFYAIICGLFVILGESYLALLRSARSLGISPKSLLPKIVSNRAIKDAIGKLGLTKEFFNLLRGK